MFSYSVIYMKKKKMHEALLLLMFDTSTVLCKMIVQGHFSFCIKLSYKIKIILVFKLKKCSSPTKLQCLLVLFTKKISKCSKNCGVVACAQKKA